MTILLIIRERVDCGWEGWRGGGVFDHFVGHWWLREIGRGGLVGVWRMEEVMISKLGA